MGGGSMPASGMVSFRRLDDPGSLSPPDYMLGQCGPECDSCWYGTPFENDCDPNWEDDDHCDCGCQFPDTLDCGGGTPTGACCWADGTCDVVTRGTPQPERRERTDGAPHP